MREIEIRVWDDIAQRMIAGFDLKEELIEETCYGFAVDGDHKPRIYIMQYAGVKDKNGVGIFEGDLLECPWRCDGVSRGMVAWNRAEFQLAETWEGDPEVIAYNGHNYSFYSVNDTPTQPFFWQDAVIVGNRYENPDLLKEIFEENANDLR